MIICILGKQQRVVVDGGGHVVTSRHSALCHRLVSAWNERRELRVLC